VLSTTFIVYPIQRKFRFTPARTLWSNSYIAPFVIHMNNNTQQTRTGRTIVPRHVYTPPDALVNSRGKSSIRGSLNSNRPYGNRPTSNLPSTSTTYPSSSHGMTHFALNDYNGDLDMIDHRQQQQQIGISDFEDNGEQEQQGFGEEEEEIIEPPLGAGKRAKANRFSRNVEREQSTDISNDQLKLLREDIENVSTKLNNNIQEHMVKFDKKFRRLAAVCSQSLQSNLTQYQGRDEQFPATVEYNSENLLEHHAKDHKQYAIDVLKKLFSIEELADSILLSNTRFTRQGLEHDRMKIWKGVYLCV
ncbi:unnamed protein product, partial [Didymodactylos carnosus]